MRRAPAERGCAGCRTPHLRAAQCTFGRERGRWSVRRDRMEAGCAWHRRFRRIDVGSALARTMRRPDRIGSGARSRQADRIPSRCHDGRRRSGRRVRDGCWGLRSDKGFCLGRRGCLLSKARARRRCEDGDRTCRKSERVQVALHSGDRAVAPAQVEARSCPPSLTSGRGSRLQSRIMLITAGTMMSSRIGPTSMPPTTTVASGR
jgi:hypothetical protein